MSTTMAQLGKFVAELHNQQDAKIKAMEARLTSVETTIANHETRITELENKPGCECGTFDDFMGAFENTEGEGDDSGSTEGDSTEDNTGGSTEGEGGSTEEEGEGEGGSTEPITATQALEEYNHLMGIYINPLGPSYNNLICISMHRHKYRSKTDGGKTSEQKSTLTAAYLLSANEGDIVKVYTPDLQEIEIIVDSICPHSACVVGSNPVVLGNTETKEIYCYQFDADNAVISPCTDEAFIAQWGNSDALGL